jgi:predicted nucleic acid-binding protein
MRVLLDTSVLVGPELPAGNHEFAISAISLAELHFGVLVARSAELRAQRLARLALIERTFDPLSADEPVAREYGRLAAAVAVAGRTVRSRVADLLIAATATRHDATLWTWNVEDFAGLGDLLRIATPAAN